MMSEVSMVLRVAAKALVINGEGRVLVVREATTYSDGTQIGRYGLPGGRIESGETFWEGLRREVLEEVGLVVKPQYPIFIGEWRPAIKGVPHQIIAVFVVCSAQADDVHLSEEHDVFEWIEPEQREKYDLVDPDWEAIDAYAERRQEKRAYTT